MQKPLFIKIAIIATLCLIFAIGLSMIQSLVSERQQFANQVSRELAEQHVRSQTIITPFIVTSAVTKTCQQRATDKINTVNEQNAPVVLDDTTSTSCKTNKQQLKLTLPKQTEAVENFQVRDDLYKRGIYHSTSFEGTLNFKQKYSLKQPQQPSRASASKQLQEFKTNAQLLIPISDLRGVIKMPTVKVNGTTLTAEYPNKAIIKDDYLTVLLPENLINSDKLDIEISLPLMGMSKIKTIPLGTQFMLSMQSNWNAPKFVGQALPNHKEFGTINKQGFTANWQNQHLTLTNNQQLTHCVNEQKEHCKLTKNGLKSFDVEFAEPNDLYLQTERSIKYGLLLIAVSFGSFFLFEIIKSLRIHPIQYLLVGMALLIFYLLLLSLAEQIAFWQAYVIAGSACAGLIGWYAYYVLHSVVRAGLFTLILAGQYAGFFTILTMEELNLLIGAILCFVLIASVMFLTRNIDWYEVA